MARPERIQALRNLICLLEPVADAIHDLREFPWDSDDELVTLTSADLVRVLDLYLEGKLKSTEVEGWAEAIEGRDDVAYEHRADDTLKRRRRAADVARLAALPVTPSEPSLKTTTFVC